MDEPFAFFAKKTIEIYEKVGPVIERKGVLKSRYYSSHPSPIWSYPDLFSPDLSIYIPPSFNPIEFNKDKQDGGEEGQNIHQNDVNKYDEQNLDFQNPNEQQKKPLNNSQDDKGQIQSLGENPGGIDLNPTNLDLQIKGEGMDFNLFYDCPEGTVQFNADKCTPRNSEQLQNLPVPGLYPVILNVVLVTNLLMLLGIEVETVQTAGSG